MTYKSRSTQFSFGLFLGTLVWVGSALAAQGQTASSEGEKKTSPFSGPYRENAPEFKLSPSEMPADIRQGYQLFRQKCAECHSLNRLRTKDDHSADEWADILYRMQDMASSHTNEAQTKAILKFAVWDDQTRKKQTGGDSQK